MEFIVMKGLIVVDLQDGFISPRANLVAKIKHSIHRYDYVVATRFKNPEGSLFRTDLNWHGDGGKLIIEESRFDLIIEKTGYGLRGADIESIRAFGDVDWDISGVETDACVAACAFSLFDSGISCNVVLSLCTSPSPHADELIRRNFKFTM